MITLNSIMEKKMIEVSPIDPETSMKIKLKIVKIKAKSQEVVK